MTSSTYATGYKTAYNFLSAAPKRTKFDTNVEDYVMLCRGQYGSLWSHGVAAILDLMTISGNFQKSHICAKIYTVSTVVMITFHL